jgi:hypothetical protein
VCRLKIRSSRRLLLAAAVLSTACNVPIFSAPKLPTRDGYQAIFVFADGARRPVAVRGDLRRIEEADPPVVRIVDLGLQRTTLLRPDRREYWEGPFAPGDEIAPGYDLRPGFDPKTRFPAGTAVQDLGDDVQAGHVCALSRIWMNDQDSVIYWAAKDLEHLVVRMEWQRLELGEFRHLKMEEMVAVRAGADPALFRPPPGFRKVADREGLRR